MFVCLNVHANFFFERPTKSTPSTLGAPTGQTEYSESKSSPPPILGKNPVTHPPVDTTMKLPVKPFWLKELTQVSLGLLSLPTSASLCTKWESNLHL
ncbi:hypothetical protein Hanom_Chr10g00941591 [Helianthus anomalus]